MKKRIVQMPDGKRIVEVSVDGIFREFKINVEEFNKMTVPVQCVHCEGIYDLTDTKVIHRYQDCTTFWSPCCNKQVDDRGEGWKSIPDFKRINLKDI